MHSPSSIKYPDASYVMQHNSFIVVCIPKQQHNLLNFENTV